MRARKFLQLFLVVIAFLPLSSILTAQSVVTFNYGEDNEFQGSLTAHLIMVGKDKATNKFTTKVLKAEDYTIDATQFKDIKVILRLSSFQLAEAEHYERSWLELPLLEYLPQNLPGLKLLSQTRVLVMGNKNIMGARRVGDIRFGLKGDINNEITGSFEVPFDFVSALFDEQTITFSDKFQYKIIADTQEEFVADFTEESEVVEETPPQQVVVEEKIEQEAREAVPQEEMFIPEEEMENDTDSEANLTDETTTVDSSEENIPTETPTETLPIEAAAVYSPPSFINKDVKQDEEDLYQKIMAAPGVRKLNKYCENYRQQYPNGYYTEDVIYTQINNSLTSQTKETLLEEYLELFPEGKYIEKVNELVLEDITEYEDEEGRVIEVASFPTNAISAEIEIQDGELFIDYIQGGVPPFKLEFYDIVESNAKNYAIEIGRSRSFKVNLEALPLEHDNYVVGIIDASGVTPFYSTPLNLKGKSEKWRNFSFISIILGSLIIAALLLLFLTNRMSFGKQKKMYKLRRNQK